MNISYTAPLSRAIDRMKALLFRQPFQIETWVVIGFAAWLSEIFSGTGGASSRWKGDKHDLADAAAKAGEWLANPTMLVMIAVGVVVFGVVLLALSWVSARAKFIFLDNVVHARPAIVEPWRRYGRLGWSLFLWDAAFSFAWLVPLAAIAWPLTPNFVSALAGHGFGTPDIPALLGGASVALLAILAIAVIATLMSEFVVPLMWRYDENVLQAWARFRPLLAANAGDFGAFVAFDWVLCVGVGIGAVLLGFMTCCIGLVLMAIPYVGAVVMLPVHVASRAFGPEFLRQFGPEWDVFTAAAQQPAAQAWPEPPQAPPAVQ